MKIIHVAVGCLLLAGAAACGGSAGGTDKPAITEGQIRQALGIVTQGGTDLYINTSTPTETVCYIAKIIVRPAEVKLFEGAGDNVATNNAHTIGIKFMGGENGSRPALIPQCGQLMSAELEKLSK